MVHYFMRNKFKLAAIATVVIISMVFYKKHFDKKELEAEAREDARRNNSKMN
jgi:hypothetical protein